MLVIIRPQARFHDAAAEIKAGSAVRSHVALDGLPPFTWCIAGAVCGLDQFKDLVIAEAIKIFGSIAIAVVINLV